MLGEVCVVPGVGVPHHGAGRDLAGREHVQRGVRQDLEGEVAVGVGRDTGGREMVQRRHFNIVVVNHFLEKVLCF